MRLPVAGLWTNVNDFDEPEGALEQADNVTSDRPGIWEPRRGFTTLEASPTINGPINTGIGFRGHVIVHHETNKISRWNGSAWSTYSGTFTPPAFAESGRVHFEAANGSLFVTTDAGVYELDSVTEPTGGGWRLTGAPKALDATATLNTTVNETGFAGANGQWAYRVEWAIKNANGRLQIGPPSGRFLVQNPAAVVALAANIAKAGSAVVTVTNTTHGFTTGQYVDVTLGGIDANFTAGTFQVTVLSSTSFSYNDGGAAVAATSTVDITYGWTAGRNVTLTIPIPTGITTDYFALVFRSNKSASATSEPNDQLAQVYERSPTNLEITAGSMTVVDEAPDDFRGTLIDVAAETVLGAKYQPPVCVDMAQYHGSTFCASTRGVQTFDLQLIAVGAPTGIQINDAINFRAPLDFDDPDYYEVGVQGAAAEGAGAFKVFTDGSAAQNIANTARSVVRTLNAKALNTYLYAEYLSSDAEAPGKIRVYARTPLIGAFSVQVSSFNTTAGDAFIPSLPRLLTSNAGQITRAANVVTVNTVQDHALAMGQQVELLNEDGAAEADFPEGIKTVATVVDPNTFTYNEVGANASTTAIHHVLTFPLSDAQSTLIFRTDRLSYSLPDQSWSVPLPNELFIEGEPTTGEAYPTIHRIKATQDRLYVWADSGLFYVTGYYPDFAVTRLQTPLKFLAPETAVSSGTPGRVYGMTDQGALEAATAAQTISTPIQNIFQDLQALAPAALKAYGFAVAYPSDFKVLFFLPEEPDDTEATNAYVYHLRDGSWSRWDLNGTSGFIEPTEDKLYIGQADGSIWVERKSRTLADYEDPGDTAISSAITWSRWHGKDPAADKAADSGMVLVQPPPAGGPEFTTMGLSFANDYSGGAFSTPETLTLDSVVTSQLPFQVPTDMQAFRWLKPKLTHSVVNQRFRLLGLSLNVRQTGGRGGP